MIKFLKIFVWIILIINFYKISYSNENFYDEGVKMFKSTKYEEAKFLFERKIVIDPKHSDSYLYLAKIYKQIDDQKNEEKNLETALLINPENEEAILMLMEIGIKKTNYSKVKELSERLTKICKNLCKKNIQILKELENLEPENES